MAVTTLTAPAASPASRQTIAGPLVRALPASSRALATAIDVLRRGAGAYALHETIPSARAAILASVYRALGGQLFVVIPTADVAERVFADLLYYLEEDEPRTVRLLRSREETVGAIESPSERSARMALLAELADGARALPGRPLHAAR
jgi:hypothetical protein